MSTARILIKQGDKVYRFVRLETRPDGSVYVILDRHATPRRGAMSLGPSGILVPVEDSDAPVPHARFSIHTTGEIHRRSGGQRHTIHIEPLFKLTKTIEFGYFSIPSISRLGPLDDKQNDETHFTLEYPVGHSDRITLALKVGPSPPDASTYGIVVDYDLYSVVFSEVQPDSVVADDVMKDHFIDAMYEKGLFENRQIDRASAELQFYQRLNGARVLRDRSGLYFVLASVPMRTAPNLKITFDRPDLRIEIMPYDEITPPTHKVRFWICDKGGRNKIEDLRRHITSIVLDARL